MFLLPSEFWRIVTVALNTGLREAKILEIDRTWLRKRDDGWWLIKESPEADTARDSPQSRGLYGSQNRNRPHGRANSQAMERRRLWDVLATIEP
jgi:hypothetical protein